MPFRLRREPEHASPRGPEGGARGGSGAGIADPNGRISVVRIKTDRQGKALLYDRKCPSDPFQYRWRQTPGTTS
jgi:hypothetical protein